MHEAAADNMLSKNIPTGAFYHARKSGNANKLFLAAREMVDFAYSTSDYIGMKRVLDTVPEDRRWSDGVLSTYQGRYFQYVKRNDDALKWYLRAEELFNEEGDDFWRVGINNDVCSILRITNRVDAAIERYDAALERVDEGKDAVLAGELISNRGNCYLMKDMFERAEADYKKAEGLFLQQGSVVHLARLYLSMAQIDFKANSTEGTKILLEKALQFALKGGNPELIYSAGSVLGQWHLEKGDVPKALVPFEAAVQASFESGFVDGKLPGVLNNYGLAAALQHDPRPEGIPPLEIALRLKAASGWKTSGTLQNLTILLSRLGFLEKADTFLKRQAEAAHTEKDEDSYLDAVAKHRIVSRLIGKPLLMGEPVRQLFRSPMGKRYIESAWRLCQEGIVRRALRCGPPLFSSASAEGGKEPDLQVEVDKKRFSVVEALPVFVFTHAMRVNYSNDELCLRDEETDENLLIEFVGRRTDKSWDDQLAAIWWVGSGNTCWVQYVFRQKEETHAWLFEVVKGLLVRIDRGDNTESQIILAEHEEACLCGDREKHIEMFLLAATAVLVYRKRRKKAVRLAIGKKDYEAVTWRGWNCDRRRE